MLAKLCFMLPLYAALCGMLWAARYYLRCGCMGSACGLIGLVPCAAFKLLSCVLVCDFLMGAGAVVHAVVLRALSSSVPLALRRLAGRVLLCWTPRCADGALIFLSSRGVARGGLVLLLCRGSSSLRASVCVKA
jgi:hypothetical protein